MAVSVRRKRLAPMFISLLMLSRVCGQFHGRGRLQVRQCVKHDIGDEQKCGEQDWKRRCRGAREGIGNPVPQAVVKLDWPEEHVPTVQAQEAPEVNAKATE